MFFAINTKAIASNIFCLKYVFYNTFGRTHYSIFQNVLESAKTDPIQLKWGFGEGLLKDKVAFKVLYLRMESCKTPIFISKRALFKTPFKLDRVNCSPEAIMFCNIFVIFLAN